MKFEDIHGKDMAYRIETRKGLRRKTFAISGYGKLEKKQNARFKELLDYFKIPYTMNVEPF